MSLESDVAVVDLRSVSTAPHLGPGAALPPTAR